MKIVLPFSTTVLSHCVYMVCCSRDNLPVNARTCCLWAFTPICCIQPTRRLLVLVSVSVCVCAASEYVCLDVDCVCAVHICIMFAIAGKGVCIKEITLKCYMPRTYIYLINSISAEVCVLS